MSQQPDAGPGWRPDPRVPHLLRWWDGARWTAHVAQRVPDPPSPRVPPPPHPTLPVRVAVSAVTVILVSLVISRFLLRWLAEYRWPIASYVGIAMLLGYGPVVLYTRIATRRHGTGHLRDDVGIHVRKADAGWGPVTWMACLVAQISLGVIIVLTDIPLTSNTEGIGELSADRGYVIALLIVAVLVAPVVEEIVFRGLVLRGLLERMGVAAAITVQAVLFGLAHLDPVRGAGNIGLVVVLSGVGAVLGAAAYRFRRLGPTMLAHAILNAVAMTLVLAIG